MLIYFAFIALLLIVSAFFSGSETAVFAFDRIEARELAGKGKGPLARLYRKITCFLPTVLLLNLLANAGTNVLATVLTEEYVGKTYLPLTGIVVTFVIIFVAEIIPKITAVRYHRRIAHLVAGPFVVLMELLRPVTFLLTGTCRLVQRAVPWKPLPLFTTEELKTTVEHAVDSNVLHSHEGHILQNILTFREKELGEFMTPRTEIVFLPLGTPAREIPRLLRLAGFARIPVTDTNDIDTVKGCVHIKEVLLGGKEDLAASMRPVYFAPECMTAGDLFHILREEGIQQAVVVDEYGQVAGLVTMHDLIEELMGDISDEYTPERPWVAREYEKGWIVNAATPVDTLNKTLGLNLPLDRGKTLGGFILDLAGHLPSRNEELRWNGWILKVQVIRRQRIAVVRLIREGA